MRRRGFTIIELLVVIGILALLMGLTLGGIAGMKKTDRLLVTEHLVGDVIRQARHTARTSGSPVLVSISIDTQGKGVVSGISRVPIWSEGFDGATGGFRGNITGVAGQGFLVNTGNTPSDVPPTVTLSKGLEIVRGGKADGFYLTCQVRPPLVSNGGGQTIPLLVIGPDTDQANSLCGLMLRRMTRPAQLLDPDFNPNPAINLPTMPNVVTWEVVGWINDTALTTPLIEVSSLESADRPVDVLRDEPALHNSVPTELDIAWPMAGGRWEEVGLLFDGEGKRLVLYRNGVRVGERRLDTVPTLHDRSEIITLGSIDLGPGVLYASSWIIDEVAVHRLAASDPKRLPGDIVPTPPGYRIVAQPDGRIEVDYAAVVQAAMSGPNAPSATTAFVAPDRVLRFSGTFNQAGHADLTVTIDGRVHGEIKP